MVPPVDPKARKKGAMSGNNWPPKFTIDQESVLKLFTGESFYSSVDASIREAVLNAIDAIGRGFRHRQEDDQGHRQEHRHPRGYRVWAIEDGMAAVGRQGA